MNVYFVRHGESAGNANGLHQNKKTPLTDQGKRQARELGRRLEKIVLDQIVCSDLVRTRETAGEVLKVVTKPIEYTPLFREIKRPTELEGRPITDPKVITIKEQIYQHSSDANWHYSDEENFFDLVSRAKLALEKIQDQEAKNILVISHGAFIRTIVGVMLYQELFTPQLRDRSVHNWETSNTGITWLRKANDTWRLITWNDHAHLG